MSLLKNDLGIPFYTLMVEDPAGDGFVFGRAYLFGPEVGQAQKGADGHVAGICEYGAKHGGDASFRGYGFGVAESFEAVPLGVPVFVAADGRVGTTGSAHLGHSVSACDAEGQKLSVDLSTKNTAAANPAV